MRGRSDCPNANAVVVAFSLTDCLRYRVSVTPVRTITGRIVRRSVTIVATAGLAHLIARQISDQCANRSYGLLYVISGATAAWVAVAPVHRYSNPYQLLLLSIAFDGLTWSRRRPSIEFEPRCQAGVDTGFDPVTSDDTELPTSGRDPLSFHRKPNGIAVVTEVSDGRPCTEVHVPAEHAVTDVREVPDRRSRGQNAVFTSTL